MTELVLLFVSVAVNVWLVYDRLTAEKRIRAEHDKRTACLIDRIMQPDYLELKRAETRKRRDESGVALEQQRIATGSEFVKPPEPEYQTVGM